MSRRALAFLPTLVITGSILAQPATQPTAQPGAAPKPVPAQPAARPTPTQPQPASPTVPPPIVKWTPKPVSAWSDPDFEKIGKLLVGSWKTGAPVASLDSAGQSSDVVINIAHVPDSSVKDVMYAEYCRADSLNSPYRHALLQLYKFKGKTRLRTYEFCGAYFDPDAFTGLWAAPEYFPAIPRANLVATLDIDLAPTANGFSGKSPYPYPTGIGGAVEMTSELTLAPDSVTSADRGYDATGKIVWGSDEKSKTTFSRFTPSVKATKKENGMVVLEYKKPAEGRAAEMKDKVGVQFSGWLTSAYRFDSSRVRGQPASFQVGPTLINGLNDALIGSTRGTLMRVYLPSALAWGEKGARNVAPGADVIFDLEVTSVEPAPPTQPPPAEPSPTEGVTPPATPIGTPGAAPKK